MLRSGVRTPLGDVDQTGIDQLIPVEQLLDLLPATGRPVRPTLPEGMDGGRDSLRVSIRRDLGDGQVAPGHYGGTQVRHDPGRVLVGGDEVHHADEQDSDGFVEVDELPQLRMMEDLPGLADIGLDDGRRFVDGEQGAAVRQNDGVVVDVDDPGAGGCRLSDLVNVVLRGQAGADSMNCRMPVSAARKRTTRPRNARFSVATVRSIGAPARAASAALRSTSKLSLPLRR